MNITTLVENTAGAADCLYEHGLSVYIETASHRILVDTGQSDALLHNANVLGIDLTKIDTVVLSHGHYDHSGGILPFSRINSHAAVYLQRGAAGNFWHGDHYIGIDPEILHLPQVQLLDGDLRLDEELYLFTHITGRRFFPRGNEGIVLRENGTETPDDFSHEQCLVIAEHGEYTLLSGCAHNGILNILDHFRSLFGCDPKRVISGFHLMKKTDYTEEEITEFEALAHELCSYDTQFYSGHCTGGAFPYLKEIMGEQLTELHSGTEII